VIVPQLVYAISTDGAAHGAYSTETVWNQSTYTIIGLAPGTYFVYSARRPITIVAGDKVVGALYSTYVTCGLAATCSTHTPLKVTVTANATTPAIDPTDWYLSDAQVPAPPAAIVPADPGLVPDPGTYASARDAAIGATRQAEDALLVESLAACPANRACVSIGVEHDGTSAAYFVGAGGSNSDEVPCGALVFKDAAGWHVLRHECGGPVFPAVGGSGQVFLGLGATGCANVRSAPGAAGKVVGCIAAGTSVQLDNGPVYSPLSGSDGVWWHITGRGWMADDFLR
jgi:hypothetical protein